MKIMQINCVYRKGSTGKIVYELHNAVEKQNMESVVCYGRGQAPEGKGVYKTCGELYSKMSNLFSRFSGLMYGGCILSTRRLISILRQEKPDVVHLHCINGYFVNIYKLVTWLKQNGIKTILTLHAEFFYTGNCGHALDCEGWKTGCGHCPRNHSETKSLFFDRTHTSWEKMRRAFAGFRDLTVVAVSPWLEERSKASPILGGFPHQVILNGLDTDIFRPMDTGNLRERLGLTGKQVVFHTTADFRGEQEHLKGGWYVLRLAEQMPDVEFLVAGSYDPAIIPPKNLRFLGHLADQSLLARYYAMADVSVLTSKRETFSMLVAESLCCGTPVAGFCAGGPESIAMEESAVFVPYGDLTGLEKAVRGLLSGQGLVNLDEAQRRYGKDSMCAAYLRIYTE